MNINDIRILSRLSPSIRFFIKKISQNFGKLVSFHLMGNPFVSAKLYPQNGNKYGFVINESTYKTNGCDQSGLAIPNKQYIHGNPSPDWFINSGKEDINKMIGILSYSKVDINSAGRILDFGCSCGRLIRHFYDHKQLEIWGTDISAEHIGWCKTYLSPPFNFLINTTAPHLPFEDNYFGLIYAGSVFTHIDDLTDAWLMELKRILKPGGFFYITMHDSETIDIYKKERKMNLFYNSVLKSKEFKDFELTKGKMFSIGRSAYSQVYYDSEYLIKMLQQKYKVLSVTKKAYREIQTGYLLKK